MNLTTARALLEDSRQQVLDNKVFRLLILLTCIPILLTILVGFHQDRMEVLWGLYTIDYAELIQSFGGGQGGPNAANLSEGFIQGVQALIVEFFAGSLGVLFCIAATAFFMPRVLEKGAADTLFSKPVGRLAILLSRYVAGLLFIAGISVVLVFGMFFGFGLRSGYWDPGFLWGALTLIYLFGMMHAFSLCIAVLTRSSTAAILMTIVLFFISGRVHWGWETLQYMEHNNAIQLMRAAGQAAGDPDEEEDLAVQEKSEEEDERSPVLQVIFDVVNTLHYVLPKTRDADIITGKLRRALSERAPELETADGELLIKLPPMDLELDGDSAGELEADGVRWVAGAGARAEDAVVVVRRYVRPEVERGVGAKRRMLPQTGRTAAKTYADELPKLVDLASAPAVSSENFGGIRMSMVSWQQPSDSGTRSFERLYFHFGTWMYQIEFDTLDSFDDHPRAAERRRNRFLSASNFVLGQELMLRQDQWYEQTFTWNAPWRFNIFFSIGSSLAFVLAMLTLAWLRLRRIDF